MKYQRLQDLREDHDLSQREVAEILQCQRVVYRRYECGEREVPLWVMAKLAEHYNVSMDYLAELTDISKPYPRRRK